MYVSFKHLNLFRNPPLQLALGHAAGAGAPICMALSLVCGLIALNGIKRVQSLDKFEKEIRGG